MLRRCIFCGTLALAMSAGTIAFPLRGSAQTIGQTLAKECPRAHEADAQQVRAHDLADDSQYDLARKASGLYYDCYHNISNPWARDWAHLFYLNLLSISARTNEQQVHVLVVVIDGFNKLAASTQYPDVQKAAVEERDSSKRLWLQLTGSPYQQQP